MKLVNPNAPLRVQNQKRDIYENPPINWKLIVGQKWNQWEVWITTQTNTPYHSVPFKLMVYFPENYPYEKPTLKIQGFERFYHPNISTKTGYICEDTLKSGHVHLTARDRINAFINLLAIPNPQSPFNLEAAKLYKTEYKKYYKKALHIFRGYDKLK